MLFGSLLNTQMIIVTIVIGIIMAYCMYQNNAKKTLSSQTKYGDNRLMKMNVCKQIQLIIPLKLALVTDLDHTLFGNNTRQTPTQSNQHINKFNNIWCNEYAPKNCVLIYATGRNFDNYCSAVREWNILKPDILVTQDGGCIHWFNKSLAQQVQSGFTDMALDDKMNTTEFIWYDQTYEAILSHGWNQSFAQQIHEEVYEKYNVLKILPVGCKSLESFHVSVLCEGKHLAQQIKQYYVKRINEYNNCKPNKQDYMHIHSFICMEKSMKDWDSNHRYWAVFTPQRAGKGPAIEFIRKRLKLKEREIICVGDSGNDISMLSTDGYNSVIVANASQELLNFYNEQAMNGNNETIIKTIRETTLGVIEGLKYYGPQLLKQ